MNKEYDELLTKWYNAKSELSRLQEEERKLRLQVKLAFFSDGLKKGTELVMISYGWSLKCVHKINRSFPDKAALSESLRKIAEIDEATAHNIVRWSPDLSEKVYESTTSQIRDLIDSVMVSKPGTPTIEIEQKS